jgi:hypothetical protein
MQDVWQAHGNSQGLNCTANDVTLASATNICVDDGAGGCKVNNTCVAGQPVTFRADFTMPLTAQARYDLGLYIATDGGGSDGAYTGACIANVVTIANSSTFYQGDPSPPDLCGDINAAHNPQVIRQTITTQCVDTNGDGKLNLPWCTSWRQPGANEVCDSTTASPPTTAANFDAYPGSPSKCNCGTLDVNIFLETATIEVTKTASPTTVPETGGTVTYAVSVKNLATVVSVTLDELTDDIYGDITTTGHDGITATTCTLATIAAGDTYNCTFTVSMGPGDTGDTIHDTVTACGTDSQNHTGLCDDDDALVTYTDVSTDPSLEKTAHATQAVRVDVQFLVAVTNNSTLDTLTLSSLSDDKFGSITSVQGNVISTTCSTPQVLGPSATYNCSFVGRITSTGLHTDVVSGAATDDDGVNYGAPPLQDSADVNITVTFP